MKKALKSRTLWTLAVMFVVGGVQALEGVMTPEVYVAVTAVLSLVAGYFKLKPSQKY